MKLEAGRLGALARELRGRIELSYKQDIALAARAFGRESQSAWFPSTEPILNGDDAAALPCGDGYVLFAAEGLRPDLLAADPWFCGFCAVMVNLNDIAAMGGRPWAVVDVLFHGEARGEPVFEGMSAASSAFGVPVVGGHTARIPGPSLLAAAVLGRARRLIRGDGARPGQALLMAVDLGGRFRGSGGNFDAATERTPAELRARLALLPELAERGLVTAGKDISMAGVCGSLLMLLETSGAGAVLDLGALPAPDGADPLRWLCAFPSFGFVLAVDEAHVATVCERFDALGVACAQVGEVVARRTLELIHSGERALYWDLAAQPLTGFGA